tara:strand:+ start:406 stop:1428 length:1023 start_codon:yes stop_codon:yes gene_type:complete
MKRIHRASALANWENEGGSVPADGRIDSSRLPGSGRTAGPFAVDELAQVTLDSIADAVISTDIDSRIVYMNSAAVELTGWSLRQAADRPLVEVLRIIDATTDPVTPDPARRAMTEDRAVSLAPNCILVRRDGSQVGIEDSAAPIHDRQGRMVGAVIIFRDVRFSHAMVDRMLYLARHDLLTGQPNRFALDEQFDLARRTARRHGWKIGVLFIDIDRFKSVNDRFGHQIGDELLVLVARCLAGCLRETDTLCRYGGDEFVVLLGHIRQAGDAAKVARKLQSCLADADLLPAHALSLSVSIGVSVYPDDGADLGSLLQKADGSMFEGKKDSPLDPVLLPGAP